MIQALDIIMNIFIALLNSVAELKWVIYSTGVSIRILFQTWNPVLPLKSVAILIFRVCGGDAFPEMQFAMARRIARMGRMRWYATALPVNRRNLHATTGSVSPETGFVTPMMVVGTVLMRSTANHHQVIRNSFSWELILRKRLLLLRNFIWRGLDAINLDSNLHELILFPKGTCFLQFNRICL